MLLSDIEEFNIFQSTRPSRASTECWRQGRPCQRISIHKALTGLDAESREAYQYFLEFQSTRPSRASTWSVLISGTVPGHFNPQGPHGPRHGAGRRPDTQYRHFNPQGPHGPRRCGFHERRRQVAFQSTRPSRASTMLEKDYKAGLNISIHKALTGLDPLPRICGHYRGISIHKALTGLDSDYKLPPKRARYFNPQGPHGPRQLSPRLKIREYLFQSTRPSRASTTLTREVVLLSKISIHKALTGLDRNFHQFLPAFLHFSKHNASFF